MSTLYTMPETCSVSPNIAMAWLEKTPLSIDTYPALKAHHARMEADEGVKRALARQSMEPIG